ncbi:nucleic acid-binding protein [Halobacteria archaeon HArc-gm2]|nr:nucleic acid-binding protein [Halobacteria archaeon HArc-gm2]
MSVTAVADAGPLIHLAEIGSIDLLDVLGRLYVPDTVYKEIADGGIPAGMAGLSYERVSSDRVGDDESLDAGEAAALAVAINRDAVLLTDDMAARDAADDAGVDVHGSIGVIALAYARGRLERDEAAERMRRLQHETSLYVSQAVVERGIEMLDS